VIEWREEGMVLAVRRHGESDAIVEALTRDHGRHAGVVRGGGGRRLAALMQPGAQLQFAWRARLEDHLGHYAVDAVRSRAGVLADPLALAGLTSVTSLLSFVLPEREAQPGLYEATMTVADLIEQGGHWPLAYLRWEMGLIDRLGFGLDLSRCAVTGSREDLAYVSPRTGRAVSRAGAGGWADRLLPLPLCMLGQGPAVPAEIVAGLRVTGHVLGARLAPSLGDRPIPAARDRLVARLSRPA